MSSEEYEKIIEGLRKEIETLKEENAVVWDMCNELKASEINFENFVLNHDIEVPPQYARRV